MVSVNTTPIQEGKNMAVINITKENFAQEVLHSEKPVLLDFWASWCGPCRMMAPVMETADAELGSAIHFTKIDVDELPDIAADFDIMSIPTIVILENGEEITRLTGAMSAEEFISQLKSIAG